ncbi:MAG: phosphoribosylamine--glycine ligase [Thermaerobacter sp.]|nr:phosphoribosylamine--glycine ligase [Thermaerobacter sp.]
MTEALRDVLVVGAGAREHAILWGLAKSPGTGRLYAAPGNAGMGELATCLGFGGVDEICRWAADRKLLVIIGPEAPLAEGLTDRLRMAGQAVVGPSQAAARLESSKQYAKGVMEQAGIPTADAITLRDYDTLVDVIARETAWPHVLKQSGLAGGKGVVVAASASEARAVADRWRAQGFDFAGGVLWETCLVGREVSVHVVTNGREYVWLPLTQDHKRLTADPSSPNTGGMGAYGPVEGLSGDTVKRINREVLDPLMQFLASEALDYRGVLYVGLMLTGDGPKVLEFNVRLGDPEAEVLIPLLDVDWRAWWWEIAQGRLPANELTAAGRHAVAVVMAAQGYPDHPRRGQPLAIPGDLGPDTMIFHGATRRDATGLLADGGRVLTVVGMAASRTAARDLAYRAVSAIEFPHHQVRPDIAANDCRE